MPDAEVVWDGGPQFAADLGRLTGVIEVNLEDALAAVARGLIPRVRSLTPKVTGRLAASVAVDKTSEGADVTESTEYAGYVEFGGSHGRPYVAEGRFLTPTVERAGGTVRQRLTREASNTIGRFPWSHTM